MFSNANLHWPLMPITHISPTFLLVWRIIFAALVVHTFLFRIIALQTNQLYELAFLTIWGMYMELILAICLLIL